MSEEKECNQVLKGLCNCKCVKNGTYPCFIEKEFLLEQQLQTAKESNKTLTQQNKQMRGLISEINSEYSDDGILSKSTKYAIQQSLKGVE